jgi:uncharacterized protein (DUF2141 family)
MPAVFLRQAQRFSLVCLAFGLGCVLWLGITAQSTAKPPPRSTAPPSGTLTILVQGLRSNDGRVSMTLYNRADGYPMKPQLALAKRETTIQNKQAIFVFPALPYGTYAVAAYHGQRPTPEGAGLLW